MSTIVLKPRMSEKTYALSNDRVYVFNVETNINKHQAVKEIEKIYKVTVVGVRTIIQKGKVKRTYGKRSHQSGRTSDFKKVYVTLKTGDAIPTFAAVKESEEKAEKSAKIAEKAAEKKAKKEKKGK